jgi:hypothetical protein
MTLTTRDPSDVRPNELVGAFLLALLLHLVFFVLLGLWSALTAAAEPPPSEEILVRLEPEPAELPALPAETPPEPAPEAAPAEPLEAPAEEAPEIPEEELEEEPPPERLLGWKTEGEEPGEAVRPPGPEAEVHGVPEPSERPAEDGGEGRQEGPGPEEGDPEAPREDSLPEDPEPVEAAPPEPEREVPEAAPLPEPEPVEPEPGEESTEEESAAPDVAELLSTPLEDPGADGLPEPLEETGDPSEARSEPEPVRPLPEPEPPEQRPRTVPPRPGGERFDPSDVRLGGGFGDLRFESADYNWSEYSTKVYFAIYRTWLRELWQAARRGAFARDQGLGRLPNLDGICLISFVIDRQGNISEVEVQEPSVVPTLDQASAAALVRSILPPLPADFPRESERAYFSFQIRGFLDEHQLRMRLDWSRRAGEF